MYRSYPGKISSSYRRYGYGHEIRCGLGSAGCSFACFVTPISTIDTTAAIAATAHMTVSLVLNIEVPVTFRLLDLDRFVDQYRSLSKLVEGAIRNDPLRVFHFEENPSALSKDN